jgi:hypothetical protein
VGRLDTVAYGFENPSFLTSAVALRRHGTGGGSSSLHLGTGAHGG